MHDADLLRDYLKNGSEAAFTELVKRYVNLVYATARRQVGAPHLAEEVTQNVFCLLARKADVLTGQRTLAGWLYRAACFQAARAVRTEQRRRRREKEAMEMSQHELKDDDVWESLSPVLDEGLKQLRETDRLAILLRFFQRKPMREVGETLGISEAAAKMRVGRAVEQLRQFFGRRGIACSSAALTVLLTEKTVQAVPEIMAATVSKAVLSESVAAAVSTTSLVRILTLMTTTKTTTMAGIAVLALVVLTTGLYFTKPASSRNNAGADSAQSGSHAQPDGTVANSATDDGSAVVRKVIQAQSLDQIRLEQAKEALHAALHIRTKHLVPAYDEIKQALEKFGDNRKAAYEFLVKEIQDSRKKVAGADYAELRDIKDHSDETIALRKRAQTEVSVRSGALWAMGQIGQFVPDVQPFLWDTVHSSTGSAYDKSPALDALHTIGFTAKDLPDLTKVLSDPSRVLVSGWISKLLRQYPSGTAPFVPAIERLLDAPDQNTRAFSALALLQHGGSEDARIVGQIQKLFAGPRDGQNRVYRVWAVNALKDAGPSARPLIPALLNYASTEPEVSGVTVAYAAIAAIDPDLAHLVPQVALALEEQSSNEQWAQKWESGSYTYDDLLAGLKQPAQALTAAAHLGEMGSSAQNAVPEMLAALEGKNEDTRDAILEDIRKIDPQVTVTKVSAETFDAGLVYATGVFDRRTKTHLDELLESWMMSDRLRGWLTREELAHYVIRLTTIDPAVSEAFVTGVLSKDPSLKSVLQTTAAAQ